MISHSFLFVYFDIKDNCKTKKKEKKVEDMCQNK